MVKQDDYSQLIRRCLLKGTWIQGSSGDADKAVTVTSQLVLWDGDSAETWKPAVDALYDV